MSRNASGICILQMIQLCARMISMGMLVGILMVLMGCMEGMVQGRGLLKEECYDCFVWGRNYECQIHGLRERKRGRLHSEWVIMRHKFTLC